MPTYTWNPSTTNTVDYVLERSVDRGLTWTNITTVLHDYTIPEYSSATKKFSYVDVAAVIGEIVRIYGRNAEGDGVASYLLGPVVSRPTCNLFGVILHAVTGDPLHGTEVSITPSGSPYTTRRANSGVPSTNGASMLGGKREFRVFTDDEGKWSLDLIRGITVTVKIPDTGFEQSFLVPEDRDVLNIADSYIYRSSSRHESTQQQWSYGPRYVP